MNIIERKATKALHHLEQARNEIVGLAYASQDGINQVVLKARFAELEEECREFLHNRYFVHPMNLRDLRKCPA